MFVARTIFQRAACLVLPFLLLFPLNALAQDEPEKEKLPDVKKLCSQVEAEYKNKKNRDVDKIVAVYQIFDEIYEKVSASNQKKIAKTVRKAFDIKPPPENKGFLTTGAATLSGMGKTGADALLSALKSKCLKPKDRSNKSEVAACKRLKADIIESIGYTKQKSALKHLFKLLWDDEAEVIKATCKALSCYNELPLKERKPIVEELVKVYAQLNSLALANPKIPQHRDKLIIVEVGFNDALQKLTYKSFESAPEWQKWYNDNKGKKKW